MASFKIPKVNVSPPRDRFFATVFFLWLAMLLLGFGLILITRGELPDYIPLFYSRVWGDGRLAPRDLLFILPCGSLFLGIFNLGFAASYAEKEVFLTRILEGATLAVSLLAVLSLVNIINLVK